MVTTELTYNELIPLLDAHFPHFRAYMGEEVEAVEDNTGVYFTYFSMYLTENWNDENEHPQLALLLQQMHASGDEKIQMTLNELLLDVCSSCKEHNLDIDLLMPHLQPALQQRLAQFNQQWLAATCLLPRGCC